METFSAFQALCVGNKPITGEFPAQSQWRGALMLSLICAWINVWVNNREAGDLRRQHAHYGVIVMDTHHDNVTAWIYWPLNYPRKRSAMWSLDIFSGVNPKKLLDKTSNLQRFDVIAVILDLLVLSFHVRLPLAVHSQIGFHACRDDFWKDKMTRCYIISWTRNCNLQRVVMFPIMLPLMSFFSKLASWWFSLCNDSGA